MAPAVAAPAGPGPAASLPGCTPAALTDGHLDTFDARPHLQGSAWKLTLRRPATVVGVRMHQSAARHGWAQAKRVLVRLDDGTELPLESGVGKDGQPAPEGWAWTRVPQIRARRITLKVAEVAPGKTEAGGFDEVEMQALAPRPRPVPTAKEWPVRLDLAGVSAVQSSPFGSSFNISFFEKGFTDGITRPGTRDEFLRLCRELPITAMRFPGGTWAYAYPPERDAFPVFKDAGMAWLCYFFWWPERFGWCSEDDFLRFCRDAGVTAWYQLNPGFWYDRASRRLRKVAEFTSPQHVELKAKPQYLQSALREARERAQRCQQMGVRVVWEIGNEDHCWWTPAGYARIAAQLMRAIRAADLDARFAVCGDSTSWSDFSWQEAMLPALRAEGIEHFDYSSVHCYFAPGGVGQFDKAGKWSPYPWATGSEILGSAKVAWQRTGQWYQTDWRARLDRYGFRRTQFAVTEMNMTDGNAHWTELQEHSMGRALGEAWGYPGYLRAFPGIFFHDLVRSGPGTGNWFQRLDYYPSHRPGCRYHSQVDLAVMRLMYRHGRGNVFHNAEGVCASRHPGAVYLTVLNPGAEPRRMHVTLAGFRPERASPRVAHIAGESLDSGCYDFWSWESRASFDTSGALCFDAPACSASGVWVKER